jgi:hypothetical protein
MRDLAQQKIENKGEREADEPAITIDRAASRAPDHDPAPRSIFAS